MKTTQEMIAVMQAYLEGKKIETNEHAVRGLWYQFSLCDEGVGDPAWDWPNQDYRIAVTKPSINWDHVASEYVCMLYSRGNWILTDVLPFTMTGGYPAWAPGSQPKYQLATAYSSFIPGTCAPEYSLVERLKESADR